MELENTKISVQFPEVEDWAETTSAFGGQEIMEKNPPPGPGTSQQSPRPPS